MLSNKTSKIEDNIIEIKYYPTSFDDFLISEEGIGVICERGIRKKLLEQVPEQEIISALKDSGSLDFIRDLTYEDFNSIAKNRGEEALKLKEYNYVKNVFERLVNVKKNIVDDFFKEILKLKNKSSKYPKALFFKDDLEEFEKFVNQKFEEVKKYAKQEFPMKPLSKKVCSSCSFRNVCLVGLKNVKES